MLRIPTLRSALSMMAIASSMFLLQGCGDGSPQVITHENRFSIEVPSYMSESSDLNTDASVQYENLFRDIYVIVIEDTKLELEEALVENDIIDLYPNSLDGFSDLISESLVMELSNVVQSETLDTTINNLDARIMTISGTFEDINGYYHLGLFEGKERYYQVLAWTSLEKRNTHAQNMKDIVYSMSEL